LRLPGDDIFDESEKSSVSARTVPVEHSKHGGLKKCVIGNAI
jgi:hypothetical protein